MKKKDFKKNEMKKLVLMGLASGLLVSTGQANANSLDSAEVGQQGMEVSRGGCAGGCKSQQEMQVARGGCSGGGSGGGGCHSSSSRDLRYSPIADASSDSTYSTQPYSTPRSSSSYNPNQPYGQDSYNQNQPRGQGTYQNQPYNPSQRGMPRNSSQGSPYLSDQGSYSTGQPTGATRQGTMSENDFMSQLNDESKTLFQSLDSEGKDMAIKLSAQHDKNTAVKMAAQKMAERKGKPMSTPSPRY